MSGLNTSRLGDLEAKTPWHSTALVAFALFFLIDAAVFRSGAYFGFIKPSSHAGMLMQKWRLADQVKKEGGALVALVGDSRLREGFSSRIFDAAAQGTDLRALNLGVSGSTPRVWYYLLKAVDPNCNAFKMLVIAMPTYFDENYYDQPFNNLVLDANLVAPVLRFSDARDFIESFTDSSVRGEIALSSLVKMYAFHRDVKDFIFNPAERKAELTYTRRNWINDDYFYDGQIGTMDGVYVENGQVYGLPENFDDAKRERSQKMLFLPPPPADFHHSNYLNTWLKRIVKRYQDSSTKIVFIHLPDEPLPSQTARPCIDRTIKQLSVYPNVSVDSTNEFAELNRPRFFFDDVHLNRRGRVLFTQKLSARILETMSQCSSGTCAATDKKKSF